MAWQVDPLRAMAPLVLERHVDAIMQTGPSGVKSHLRVGSCYGAQADPEV